MVVRVVRVVRAVRMGFSDQGQVQLMRIVVNIFLFPLEPVCVSFQSLRKINNWLTWFWVSYTKHVVCLEDYWLQINNKFLVGENDFRSKQLSQFNKTLEKTYESECYFTLRNNLNKHPHHMTSPWLRTNIFTGITSRFLFLSLLEMVVEIL